MRVACFPAEPKGNGTQTSHKYVTNRRVTARRDQHCEIPGRRDSHA